MKGTSLLALFFLFSCAHESKAPIDSKDRQYKQCYEESDAYRNNGNGRVEIGFRLQTDGKIEDEKILSTAFKDPNFHACLLQITRELKLPLPKASTQMTKTINFSSQKKI